MPTLTSCPSCSKQLKVPDELLGRQVKCPACGTTFTATAAMPPGAPPSPPMMPPAESYGVPPAGMPAPAGYGGGYDDLGMPPPPTRRTTNKLVGPGVALLVSAILNVLFGAYLIVNGFFVINNPKMAIEANPFFQNKQMTPEEKQEMENVMKMAGPGYAIVGFLGVLCAILTIIGAIMMIRGNGGGMAWTAAVISVIPCTAPCCCTGIPIGIWAMIALKS